MPRRPLPPRLTLAVPILAFCATLAAAVSGQEPLKPQGLPAYKLGQAIPVSCLNRTIDTGEHITDEKGQLQYIPFPTCNETGRPLELSFGVEQELNCTIDFISDPLFHLLEFYIHNDAPLTCRIPSRPLSTTTTTTTTSSSSPVSSSDPLTPPPYTPLIFALTGTLQLSHLHISPHLNVLLHAAPRALAPGAVAAATAYSVAPAGEHARLVIGDALPLRLSVRWYPGTALPSGWAGVGGHVYWSTLAYCVISAGVGAVAAGAWVRAFWLPGRLRRERVGGEAGYGAGRYAGYGVGVGGAANGFGYGVGVGKRD